MALTLDVTGFTEQEVLAIFDAAKASLLAGSNVVSWSSAGSSVSKQITSSPAEVIGWCQWALKELNPEVWGFNRRRTVATFNNGGTR